MNFYTEPLSDLLKHFDADPQKGLNQAQLEQARQKYGKNVLREQKKPSLLMRFLAQFKDTMIIILIIAAIISFFVAAQSGETREFLEPALILAIVILNAIMGMTQIARDNAGDWDKTDECLATIQTSSQHLLSLINDVLDMSKIESGAIELQEECCDLDTLLRDVDAIMRPQTAAKGQLLTLDAVNVQHRNFAADQLRVRQILLNLLSNAVKYTPDGGMVALHVEEHEQTSPHFVRLSFIVRDNGMGMPPEFIDHVFVPFERAESRQMQGIQGTGLGMTITKALVDAMGGTIDVESREGHGTTFTVKLKFKLGEGEGAKPCPCKAAESDPGKEKRTGKDAERGRARGDADEKRPSYTEVFKGRRYLVAEDNQINRIILAEMLTERGATLEQAQNGKEAVELFAESEPQGFDAGLMDAMMPVMDGYEATRAIRKLPRPDAQTTPIVALTANAYADDVKKALDSGMNAHVGKPFKIADLAKALDEKFPGKRKPGAPWPSSMHNPLKDGDEMADEHLEYAGSYVLRSGSKNRPVVMGRRKEALAEEDGVVYSGCFCNVSLAAAGFDAQVKKGVTCYLNGVQFVRDGERLAGYDASNDFEDLGEDGDDYDDII